MNKLGIATLALAMAIGLSGCKFGNGPTPNENQGTVTQIEHHPANDETVLYLRLTDGSTDTDTMVTSAHDWDACGIGATWPACLKSHGG